MNELAALMKDETGVTTVEIILILLVLIALVLIFKKQLISLVNAGGSSLQGSLLRKAVDANFKGDHSGASFSSRNLPVIWLPLTSLLLFCAAF